MESTITLDLLNIALNDIKSANALYAKRLYAQSYFSFQQAAEKANKAYGLFSGIITEAELKEDIRHNQLKIYRKGIIKEKSEIEQLRQMLANRPDVAKHDLMKTEQIEKYFNQLNEGLKFHDSAKQVDLLNCAENELLAYLEMIEELYNVRIRRSKETDSVIDSIIALNKDFADKFYSESAKNELYEGLKQENKADLYSTMYMVTNAQLKTVFINYTFYFCALITIRHNNLARYPDGGLNPLAFYTKKNMCVKYQPDFVWYLEKGVLALKKFIEGKHKVKVGKTSTEVKEVI
ncbi:MAG TPA: HEPN domain-containing protein [Flavobacteriales bacterium]|nr:HEPN domain-containing protein [Flavobacteriales bacterium]